MNNKKLVNGKDKNQIYKDIFIERLKDRKKIKGYSFSFNKKPPIIDHSHIQKILYKTYNDISKKIIKENTFKYAMEDYKELKHNIISFEQKYKDYQKKKLFKNTNFSYDKINYTNLKEIFSEFLRDKKKHNNDKISIIKSKIKLDNINRNIRKNRINSILAKVSLHSKKIKTRVDTGKNRIENYENNYKNLIRKINESRKKLGQQMNNSRRKKTFLDINKKDNKYILDKQKYISKTKSNYDIKKRIDSKEDIKMQKQEYLNLYNSLDDNNEEHKSYLCKNKNEEIKVNNSEENKNSINIKTNERPLSYSRNRTKLNIVHNNTSSSDINIINKRIFKSACKREVSKIKNKPLYTTKIDDIMNEYYRIKKNSKISRIKYKEAHLLTYKEIDNIINIKEDLLIFSLKQKYLNKKFPKPIIKRKNKKELFIKKFKDDLEFLDNKLKNFVLLNNSK